MLSKNNHQSFNVERDAKTGGQRLRGHPKIFFCM